MQHSKNVKQEWALLGLVGYYQKCIKNFAWIPKPLMTLTFNDAIFDWTPIHQVAFISLKGVLIEAPILHYTRSFKMMHTLHGCLWWCIWCSATTGTQWPGTTSCISFTYIHRDSMKMEHSQTRSLWCLLCHNQMELLSTAIWYCHPQWPQTLPEVSTWQECKQ